MTPCIYYRRGYCVNPESCPHKVQDERKHDVCNKSGQLSPLVEKSSAGPRGSK